MNFNWRLITSRDERSVASPETVKYGTRLIRKSCRVSIRDYSEQNGNAIRSPLKGGDGLHCRRRRSLLVTARVGVLYSYSSYYRMAWRGYCNGDRPCTSIGTIFSIGYRIQRSNIGVPLTIGQLSSQSCPRFA